jgi:HSP20 family protein
MERNYSIVRFSPRALMACAGDAASLEAVTPQADIFETNEAFVVKLDMPGASKETIRLTIDADELSLEAAADHPRSETMRVLLSEIGRKNYRRTFMIGDGIDEARTEATFEDGVLTITLPKVPETKPKQIDVKVK